MIEHFIEDVGRSLGQWAYLLVALMAFAETAAFIGFIAPGEVAVLFGGVLAGEGTLSIVPLIGIVWAAAVLGDTVGFMLGRRLGRNFALRYGHYVRLSEERLKRVDSYFSRDGGKTILAGRWIGFIRPLMPFTAGTSAMPFRRFLPYDVLSAGAWTTTFCLLGFIFWHSFKTLTKVVGRGALAFGVIVVVVIGGVILYRRLRQAEERRKLAAWYERQRRRPLLRPVAFVLELFWRFLLRPLWSFALAPAWRLLHPPLRFLAHRLTPGHLGIELTSLLAIGAVSGYVFGLYTDLVVNRTSPTLPGDVTAMDIAADVRNSFLTGVVKVVTFSGTRVFTSLVLLLGVAILLRRRQLIETLVLLLAFVAVQIGQGITKAAVDRPRPPHPLIDVGGSSFPSGHAANAITYLALAVLLARLVQKNTLRLLIVLTAIALAIVIGLSRVYLRVHYLSDVSGGWAMSLAIFSLCGSVALVISYLRDNDRPADEGGAEPAPTPSGTS
jgi:membrane protein DedA with SNARE-associated domain/membrane-associated phospholipid phosphatase